MMQYKLVDSSDALGLSALVSNELERGWSLYEAPFYAESRGLFVQALVKYEMPAGIPAISINAELENTDVAEQLVLPV